MRDNSTSKWRALRVAALGAATLGLSACSLLGDEFDLAAEPPPAALDTKIAALETALAAERSANAELQKRLVDLSRRTASLEETPAAPAVEPPALKDEPSATALRQPPAVVSEIKPETMVAAADADMALASAPAKPVEPSPRLVQPSFASHEATVFENEAGDAIATASVLFGVHLASYRHAEEARAGWAKLQRDYPDELGLLEPRLERVAIEGRGEFLRLIGGGFSNGEKAAALCARLKTSGVYCAVASFEGERLSLAEQSSG